MNSKILVIGSNPVVFRFAMRTLEREGYRIVTSSNGRAGLRKAQKEKPDLIILDIMLPGMDGFEVCHRLRSVPQTAEIPVLMLTTNAQRKDGADGLLAGTGYYSLIKPTGLSAIAEKVESLLVG